MKEHMNKKKTERRKFVRACVRERERERARESEIRYSRDHRPGKGGRKG